MTSRDFAYWLQGFFEIQKPESLDKDKIDMIHKHLNLVFIHEIDPSYGGVKEQAKLNGIHNPPKIGIGSSIPNRPGGPVARC